MFESIISVIIPFYNASAFFEECIISVVNQEKVNIEIIVVNDGSSASEKQFISIQQDNYGFKLIHQENKGVSAARNTGLNIATGNHVLFLDADDELLPHALSMMLEKNDDIVIGHYIVNGKVKTPALTPQQFIQGNPIQVGTALIKMELAKKNQGFKATLCYSEDMDFWFRLWLAEANFNTVNKTVLNYREHKNSAMQKKSIKLYSDNVTSFHYRIRQSEKRYGHEKWFKEVKRNRMSTIHWYARLHGFKTIISNYMFAFKMGVFTSLLQKMGASDWRYVFN
jgi:glycosyltransferase involved in cell wall biosynthesis